MYFSFFGVFGNHIVSKRGLFVIRIGNNGLVLRNRCLTFLGIDTPHLIFFRVACLVFPRLFHFVFSSMRFLVLLSASGFLNFSKNSNFNSKMADIHLLYFFISKVIFSSYDLHFSLHVCDNSCSRLPSVISLFAEVQFHVKYPFIDSQSERGFAFSYATERFQILVLMKEQKG